MFFDRPEAGERAMLVHCYMSSADDSPRAGISSASNSFAEHALEEKPLQDPALQEFVELAESSGVSPIYLSVSRRHSPTPRFFLGSGKVDELVDIVNGNSIDVVLFNHTLSPSQERNLEEVFKCKVLDRTGLILDIFAQRARSHAGKLQVELAQLDHISTRLIRGWTHLERQKGGIGMRGPGETQLETDRRLLRERVKWINKRLEKVNAQREQSRRSRSKAELPTVSLVGYTNAGKSTLFNAVTEAKVYAKDQLFATLDTTLRRVSVTGFGPIVLADTVGFVKELPHKLVEAFKATLEEAAEADLLLHVIDASAENYSQQINAVEAVLAEIGAGDLPCLQVMNKIDCLAQTQPRIDFLADGKPQRIWLSARELEAKVSIEDGAASQMELLFQAIAGCLLQDRWKGEVQLGLDKTRLRAKLYEMGAVLSEEFIESEASAYRLQLSYELGDLTRVFAEEGEVFQP